MAQKSQESIDDLLQKQNELEKRHLSLYFEVLVFVSLGFYLLTDMTLLLYVSVIAIISSLVYNIVIKHKLNQYSQKIKEKAFKQGENLEDSVRSRINREILVTVIQLILIVLIFFL
ncbi:hypothetical protein [Staphylococcus epidermidis]|uniref:hypothetical protein n=1 Tax=Staphylococcus epidermidis TaxID=1282 RepID=UPI00352E84C9